MKKYSDWQKYVREQSDRTGQKPPETEEAGQPRIRRTTSDPAAQEPPAAARPPKPQVERRVFIQRDQPPRPPAETTDPPRYTGHMPAPFVSVHDVWKAAEKSTRGRTTGRRREEKAPGTGRLQQSRLPGMEFTPPVVQTPTIGTPRKPSTQSREEILERLVNPTVSLEEAAKIMGVCKATVRRYTAKGILPHYRTPGNQRRFKLNDIIQFLEGQRR